MNDLVKARPCEGFLAVGVGERKGEKEHKTTERKKQTNTNYDMTKNRIV